MTNDLPSDAELEPPSRTGRARAVRLLSEQLVRAQHPVRILDAVHWDESVEEAFLAAGGRELPPVTPDYYHRRPLRFDPDAKQREFRDLERDVVARLGRSDPAGHILARMCREYHDAVEMLRHRGTPRFAELSRRLYGSTRDHGTESRLAYLLACLPARQYDTLHRPEDGSRLDAVAAVGVLSDRLGRYFPGVGLRVKLCDGILADASAGCDYLKVRRNATFTHRDLRLLEVHEGWVHLGTTLNGRAQPVCGFLAKGPPSSTRTQEGLAVLTEFLTDTTHPARLWRLRRRLEGVAAAERGADFRDVYRSFLDAGDGPRESFQQAARIFRGSLPAGCGPFTKDLCYSEGLLKVARFVWGALAADWSQGLSVLFCGKTAVEDADALAGLADEGLVTLPRHLPPLFRDPTALADRLTDLPFLHVLNAPGRHDPMPTRRHSHLDAGRSRAANLPGT